MGEAWVVMRNEIDGQKMGDVQLARSNRLNRSVSFLDRNVRFRSDEAKIRTRLGDEGIETKFAPAPPSPFEGDETIGAISIPVRWLGETRPDEPVAPTVEGRAIRFQVGGRQFAYDRLGLWRQ